MRRKILRTATCGWRDQLIINWPNQNTFPNLLSEVVGKAEKKVGECEVRFREGPALESESGEAIAHSGYQALKHLNRLPAK